MKNEQASFCFRFDCLRGCVCDVSRLLVVVSIDGCVLPLAGLNLAAEENVDLAVGAVLHLGEPPPGHGGTDESSASPDVSALATKVATLSGIMSVRRIKY